MIRRDVLLRDYSNYRIGGPASYFLEISSKEELMEGLQEWADISSGFSGDKKKIFILGKGTNILISEKGFDGLIIQNKIPGIEKKGEDILVGAGETMAGILAFCIDNSLTGLEWAGGLPGSIGGAIRGNAGAFKGEMKDSILQVVSLNYETLEEKIRAGKECNFSYRNSIFKSGEGKGEIILSVSIGLSKGNRESIRKSIEEKINYRNEKHPMEFPSIGSTFKNIPVNNLPDNIKDEMMQYVKDDPFPLIPVAKLLYLCNLKGKREGDAQISEKHPNFIINLGNAKFEDVKKLIEDAKDAVREKFGVELEEEIIYLN